ncbi:MAG TPA: hypothetical protein PKM25_05775, partial [Candidatus Ozemobacteraceae bacterium]|nr:hypothetical protein [Candidatus Ozemobacteraceae bacterium]
LECLGKMVPMAFKPRAGAFPKTFSHSCRMPATVILLEVLARMKCRSAAEPARKLFLAAQSKLVETTQTETSIIESLKRDVLPLLAASAAALLALNKSGIPAAMEEREAWESACVRTALDPVMHPATGAFDPPLSFLFIGSPSVAGCILTRIMAESEGSDGVLRIIGAELREARKSGLSTAIEVASDSGKEQAQKLDELVTTAGEWGTFVDIPAWAAMEIRRSQGSGSVSAQALELFRNAMIRTSLIHDALEQIADEMPLTKIPAITVEATLANRVSDNTFRTLQEHAETLLNTNLKKAGIPVIQGLSWIAPKGAWHTLHDLNSLDALEETLRAIYHSIHDFAATLSPGNTPTPAQPDPATNLRMVFPHTLCRHAIYRTLICELKHLNTDNYTNLLSIVPEAEMECDAGMISAIAKWIGEDDAEPFNALLARFLNHRLVRDDMGLVERIVSNLARTPNPAFAAPLKTLKRHIIRSVPAQTENRFHALQTIDGLLLSVGNEGAVTGFLKKLAAKGYVPTEEKMTILRLAASGSVTLDQSLFENLFAEAIESENPTYPSWTSAITGNQAREYLLKILREKNSPDSKVISVAKYCFWARRDGIPAAALAPILERLGPAVTAARGSPGETWEDRNWGGYNTSSAEDLACALSLAVKGFVEKDCKAVGWPELIAGLATLDSIDLGKITLGDTTGTGFNVSKMNLFTRLTTKIGRLHSPELDTALAALAPKPAAGQGKRS